MGLRLDLQGDFRNYSQGDFQAECELAKAAGIDAFAMNVGHDSTDSAELTKAFSAAASVPDFYLFFSFDMNYFSTSGSSDTILNDYLVPFANSSAYYLHEGQVFVSTFSAEVAGTFLDGAGGFEDSNTAWSTLLDNTKSALGKDVTSSPTPNDVSLVPQDNWGGGVLSWAAWGDKGRTTDMTTDSDVAYRAAATKAGLSYVAPVAAFSFVHVAASNNYVLQSNNFLFSNHYSDLIKLDPGSDFIEILIFVRLAEPAYAETLGDTIFAVALIPTGSKASKLVVTTGGSAEAAQDVSEGVNLISVNFVAGSTGISLQDSSGNETLSGTGADINASPATYDFVQLRCYILPADATPSCGLVSIAHKQDPH
ncbi:hypothetical protein JCM21900_006202 [Sporobolomyces salmonicolor]